MIQPLILKPASHPIRTGGNGGFILMEVLLALLVLMTGSLFVFRSYRGSLQALRFSRELFAASLLMESRIGELEITGRAGHPVNEDPLLGPLVWNDERKDTDVSSLAEHDLGLHWGEVPRARQLEETIYVWE